MKRILFYNPTAPDDPSCGGIASYIAQRAAVLASRGFAVSWGNRLRFAEYDPERRAWITHPFPAPGRFSRLAGRVWLPATSLWAYCRKQAVEAVELADGATFLWPAGKPFRIGIQCHNAQQVRAFLNRQRPSIRMALMGKERAVARVLERADGVLACSHEIAFLTAGFYRIHPDCFTVLPHAFDRQACGPLEEAGERHDGYFLMAGNIEYVKGFDLVAEGFRRYRQKGGKALLVVAGTGGWTDRNPWVQSMLAGPSFSALVAQEGRDCVRFLGVLNKTELARWRARATACVVGSRFEAFTMVAGEAFFARSPLLLSCRTGWRGLAERFGAARLFDPYDPEDLTSAFAELEDPGVRRRLQERGGALADWLAGPELAARTAAWYRRLAEGTVCGEEAR